MPIQITPASIPGVATGLQYSQAFTATGGSGAGYSWSLLSGSLPGGFTFTPAGVLSSSGSPAAAANTYSFWIEVTDSANNTATQLLTLVIGCPVTVKFNTGDIPPDPLPVAFVATFTPPNPDELLSDYAQACGYSGGFDWVQTVIEDTTPPIIDDLGATLTVPYPDPPYGGYTYEDPTKWTTGSQAYLDAESFDSFQPGWATAYPFYYNPEDIYNNDGCAEGPVGGPCTTYMTDDYTLWFYDVPNDSYCAPPAPCLGFQTQLVGICYGASPVCNSSGPSAPLFQWTWYSNYNGSVGGIYGVGSINVFPPDPNSGTGSITITSINGVPYPLEMPTVTVTPPAQSITTAQALSVSVAVNGGSGNQTPTGSLTLTGGGYTSAATALSSGNATINVPAGSLPTGTYTLTVSYVPDSASSSIYYNSAGSASVVLTALALTTPTVTVTPGSTSITTAQPLTVTVAVSGTPTPTGSVILTGGGYNNTQTLSSGSTTFSIPAGSLNVGGDTFTANYTPDSNSTSIYNSATGTSPQVTVTQATQTITFGAIAAQTVGTPLTLSATASSGLTVSFASTTTSVCTVSGTTATFIAAGSCTIDATQVGNSIYAAATMVPQTFTVNGEAQTITFGAIAAQTVGTPLTLSATTSSGLTVSFASTTTSVCTVSGAIATFISAGSCTIDATQAGNSTYAAATMVPQTIAVNGEAQTITFGAIAAQTVGTPLTLSATASSGLTVSFISTTTSVCTVSGKTATFIASGTCTIDANQAGNSTYAAATMVPQSFIVNNPLPVISSISPAFTSAGSAAFTLTVTGSGFVSGSTVYWGTSALTTTYGSATQLTAQLPATDIASAGITAVTEQTPTPGGGTSNSLQFEVDSTGSGATPPNFTTLTATVTAGSPASYSVTLPSTVERAYVSCLNLPTGAACSYSETTNTLTITTSSTTPKGTYQITVVFTETVSGAAPGWILLPILLLPMVYMRKKLAARGVWVTACLGLVLLAAAYTAGCGGGGNNNNTPPPQTHQVVSSGSVSLTIQ